LRERIAALAPAILPKGVGAYSAAVLHYEMRGFERFKNRRQVGSMTGLCPGIHLSDGRGKEGSIKPLRDWDCALDLGGDGVAPDDSTLVHHLDQVAGAEFKGQVPPHAQHDNLLVKMPPLEEILCRGRFRHPGRYGSAPGFSSVCTRTLRRLLKAGWTWLTTPGS
jgi:Transposase IS116/IS110/IS902 family